MLPYVFALVLGQLMVWLSIIIIMKSLRKTEPWQMALVTQRSRDVCL